MQFAGSPVALRIALAGLLGACACFSEPAPLGGEGGTDGCTQASCSGTSGDSSGTVGDTTTGEPGATTLPGLSPPMPTSSSSDSGSSGPWTSGPSTSGPSTSGPSTSGSVSDGGVSDGGEVGIEDPSCGDGEVNQPSEMCDSTPGCRDDCTFDYYGCNPLNDANCVAGFRCGAGDPSDQESFVCMLPGIATVGEPCYGVGTNDGDCAAGLTCLRNGATPWCDSGNCCVEYCDLTDSSFVCSAGATCLPFLVTPSHRGLEHLGYCGE